LSKVVAANTLFR